MSLKILLQQKIGAEKQVSRDALRIFGRQNNFDVATCDRKCRELTQDGKICPVMQNGYIVAYKPVASQISDKYPQKQRKETEMERLNTALRVIIQKIPLKSENYHEIEAINKIINSNNIYNKGKCIEIYEKN